MTIPTLIYFAARGRAEVIRLALEEAGVAYQEEHIKGQEEFAAMKASGRLPFLAVPVWVEGDFTLAQSGAIGLHIARNHGLYGSSAREQAQIDQALGAIEDVRNELRKLMLAEPAKRAEVRAELLDKTLPRWFGMLEKLLTANQNGAGFLVGSTLSIADLTLWYLIEMSRDNGFESALAACPKLLAHFARVAARPRIAAYLASSRRPALQLLPS